jgi:predicted Rdx family selenoprotein
VKGHGGVFEVIVNNDKIYDNKKVCGRLPSDEEILEKLKVFII